MGNFFGIPESILLFRYFIGNNKSLVSVRSLLFLSSVQLFVTMPPGKHVTLTLDQKVEIIESTENGHGHGTIAEKYEIGKSTVLVT